MNLLGQQLNRGKHMRSKLSMAIIGALVCVFLAAGAWAAPVSVDPLFGDYMFYLGTVDADGDDVNDYTGESGFDGYSTLSISVTGVETFGIAYYFLSWDYEGFDEPGFYIDMEPAQAPEGVASGPDGFSQGVFALPPRLELNAADVDTDGPESAPGLDFTEGWQAYVAEGLDPFATY